jgi:hypothetical protein
MADLPGLLNTAMDAAGDPYFNTGNNILWVAVADPTIGADIEGGLYYIRPEDTGDPDAVISWFLFGTGPNSLNSAASVLGFAPGQDVGGYYDYSTSFAPGLFVTYPIPLRAVDLYAMKYVDVYIAEVSEHEPLARIFLLDSDDGYTVRSDIASNVRILDTNPLRRIETLNVILRFEKDRLPPPEIDTEGYDLKFELTLLEPSQSIPSWATQLITY